MSRNDAQLARLARKGPIGKRKSPLQIYNVGASFERIQIDILGLLPSSIGNRYLLVVMDCFKGPKAIPLKSKRSSTVAKSLVDEVFFQHGIPLIAYEPR